MTRSIRDIRNAISQGQEVTAEERAFLLAYDAKYRQSRHAVYIPKQLWDEWKSEAQAQGAPVSAWIRDCVEEARSGVLDAKIAVWRREVERSARDKEIAQAAFGDLASQLREKDFQIRTLTMQLQDALALMQNHFGQEAGRVRSR